jgi:hypothetical protein
VARRGYVVLQKMLNNVRGDRGDGKTGCCQDRGNEKMDWSGNAEVGGIGRGTEVVTGQSPCGQVDSLLGSRILRPRQKGVNVGH